MKKGTILIKNNHHFSLLAIVVLLALIPLLGTNNYIIHLIEVTLVFTVLSLSLNVLSGFAGQISFGHAGFYAIGAYASALLEIKVGFPMELSLLITLLGCALIGVVVGYPILRLRGHYLGMATLAIGLLIQQILNGWVSVTGGTDGMMVHSPILFGITLGKNYYYFLIVCALATYLFCRGLKRSKVGLAMRTVREEEMGAKALGINVTKYKVMAFAISSTLAGLAGIMYAHLNSFLNPDVFSLNTSIQILTMVIIGGLGSNRGAVMGAVLMSIVPELFQQYQGYHLLIYGVMLLLFLIFLPNGLVSIRLKRKDKGRVILEKEKGAGVAEQ
ncbi:MAG: branched-chain amino acid ABC transporter permease [Firmicutes bacterium]|nr:branched-chain amino acid ABC transporter permease [Bacillota bacterium]